MDQVESQDHQHNHQISVPQNLNSITSNDRHHVHHNFLLFSFFPLTTWINKLVACIMLFILSILYEFFKCLRQAQLSKVRCHNSIHSNIRQKNCDIIDIDDVTRCHLIGEPTQLALKTSDELKVDSSPCCRTKRKGEISPELRDKNQFNGNCSIILSGWSRWKGNRLVQSLLYTTQILMSYGIMLSIMTLDPYIILSVISGSFVGSYIVYPISKIIISRSCVCE